MYARVSYIYGVRPPNRFQVEIIEVEKVKVDWLRLKYLAPISPSSVQFPHSSIKFHSIVNYFSRVMELF